MCLGSTWVIQDGLISKPSLLLSKVPGIGRGRVFGGPIQSRTRTTLVFAAVVANTPRADAPLKAVLRAWRAQGPTGSGGQRTRGLAWDMAGRKRKGAGGQGKLGCGVKYPGQGQLTGKVAFEERGRGSGRASQDPAGRAGRAATGPCRWKPCPWAWRPGNSSLLKATCRSAEKPGDPGWEPQAARNTYSTGGTCYANEFEAKST